MRTQTVRDHTKRKVFEQHEVERYALGWASLLHQFCHHVCYIDSADSWHAAGKLFDTLFATLPCLPVRAPKRSCSLQECTLILGRRKSGIAIL